MAVKSDRAAPPPSGDSEAWSAPGRAGPDRLTATAPDPSTPPTAAAGPFVVILGIAQDAGYPQAGCRGACCAPAWADSARRRHAACAAVVDPASGARWLLDATPDFRAQLRMLDAIAPHPDVPGLDGILLTHAHVGHYAGLLHLGREAIDARRVPVYGMPRLAAFLGANQPWADLVAHAHVIRVPLAEDRPVTLATGVTAVPVRVPHRDEHSETVGFRLTGPRRTVLYLPDIDGWDAWDAWGVRLEAVLAGVDVAYLDGTFWDAGELGGRRISDVPHPLITATLERLASAAPAIRSRVRFIHLNHTNPLLAGDPAALRRVAALGCAVAREGERIAL